MPRRIPTNYHQHRTETGRLSSGGDLNGGIQVQNFPRALRDVVVAEPGKVLIAADWAAIEWCIAMWFAGQLGSKYHQDMLAKYQHPDPKRRLDPHRLLASVALNKPESLVTKQERKNAKPITFGYLFKGGALTLSRETRLPLAWVKRGIAAHDQVFQLQAMQNWVLEEVKQTKCVTTAGGWKRWFWSSNPKPTEVLATKIQGTAADLMKWVLAGMWAKIPPEVEILTTTHDSLLIMAPLSKNELAQMWLLGAMQQPVPFLGDHRFRAEVSVGRNWREVS